MPSERCAFCDRATTTSMGNPGSDTPNEVQNDSTARMNRIVGQVSGS
jgi:hypothetical protein